MFNRLKDIIKKTEGNVLVVGLDDKLLETFNGNSRVNLLSIYSEKTITLTRKLFKKNKKRRTNKGKIINVKKLRKYIKKKSVDYLIINMEEIIEYYKYIIKDTIYLNNNKIYIYSSNKIDKDFIIKKYKRYDVKIDVSEYKNGYILTIDNNNGKNNMFKDFIYLISDTFYNVAEFIGNVLIS